MAHVFAQADTSSVGTDRDLELLRKEQDSQQLIYLREQAERQLNQRQSQ